MNQDNLITLYCENANKCDQNCEFFFAPNIYFGLNEQIDMIPSKLCQTYSGTGLENQQGVVWLQTPNYP